MLTLTDPQGGSQTVDILADLADSRAVHSFAPLLPGTYTATAIAVDTQGERSTSQRPLPVVAPDTSAPQVTLTVESPTPVVVGQSVTLRVSATDDRRVVHTALTINTTPLSLASDGTATYIPTAPGFYMVHAEATDAAGNTGATSTTLTVLADTDAPMVQVTVTPAVVPLTQPVTITVTATDNVAVTTRAVQVRNPVLSTGMPLVLDAAGRAVYSPYQPGLYTVSATAQDPAGNTGTSTATFEAQGVPDTTPPVVSLSGVPTTTAVGRPVTLTVTATDDVEVTALTLLLNDTPQPLDPAGRVTYTPPVVGTYAVVALAQDGTGNQGSTTVTFQAIDAAQDTEPPLVAITTPSADATVTAPTTIRGTVQDATLVRYTLAYSPRGEEHFTAFAMGTTEVIDGVLGMLDPTLLPNDLYDLHLTAEDANGRTTSTTVVVRVAGQIKVGHLSFTIGDLTIPVVGLPITINRTYDSRDTTQGDFGVGWRLDVQSVKLRENRVFGTGWQQGRVDTFTYCVEPHGAHYVVVTLPDGRTEAFDVTLESACQTLLPVQETTVTFTAQPGTFSRLEAVADNTVLVVGSLNPGVGNFAPVELLQFETDGGHYNPTVYRLTTPEGLVFDLDQTFGVRRITEPNGHTLTFGPGGILHSADPGVVFTRDAQGRITQITDPNGHTLTYTYDTNGDLVAVTDQVGFTTRYTYEATHKLAAQLHRPVPRSKVDVVLLALQRCLVARIGFRAVSRVLS